VKRASAAEADGDFGTYGTAEQAAEKLNLRRKGRPLGLKPHPFFNALRGPEGPLFHACADIRESFRSL